MGNFFGFCLEFCQSAFHIFQYFLKECILIFFFKEKAKADEALSTTTPSPTEAAGVTETPAPTEEAKATETPAPTEEAKVTDTPAPNETEEVTETPSPTEAEDNETSQETTAGWYKNPVIWILITVVLAGLLLVYNKKKKDQK